MLLPLSIRYEQQISQKKKDVELDEKERERERASILSGVDDCTSKKEEP